jgi:hypothetical protein
VLLPDFTSFDPGYDKSDKKGKRNAGRRLLQPAVQLARPLPPLHILPRMRGYGGGSSPVGVPPRFSLGEYSIPKLRLQARLPGTRQERRSVTFPLPEAASDAVVAGVTRPNLSQSSGSTPPAGRNAGLHDARSRPGAECVGPPAGTALAPHNREHPRDGVPYRARFANGM